MRIVLDTNILVRANNKARGPARDLLLEIAFGGHVLIISPFLLREVERAVLRPCEKPIAPFPWAFGLTAHA